MQKHIITAGYIMYGDKVVVLDPFQNFSPGQAEVNQRLRLIKRS